MALRRLLLILFFLTAGSLLLIGTLIYGVTVKQDDLYQSQVERYTSYLLADELRQSSDDLTRLARTYVVTGDDKYEKMYWDILAIRNGDKARPEHMEHVYWDLVLNIGDKPRRDGPKESLQSLMKKAGFTEQEFNKLTEAQRSSDDLVTTEIIAMNAVKGLYDDGNGNYIRRDEPNLDMARRIMHDNQYHIDKTKIMVPIKEFQILLDERTLNKVATKKSEVAFYQDLLFVTIIFTFIIFSLTGCFIYRGIMTLADGEPEEGIRVNG